MRFFVPILGVAILATAPLPAIAQGDLSLRPAASPPPAGERDAGRRATLDDLFARLGAAKDEAEA